MSCSRRERGISSRKSIEPGCRTVTSFLCYSNNPQVHAFDNTTLVENLAGQAQNVESARHFTPRPSSFPGNLAHSR
jgi:hypothetical protein